MVELLRPWLFTEKITYRSSWKARVAWRRTQPFPRVCRDGFGGLLQESLAQCLHLENSLWDPQEAN